MTKIKTFLSSRTFQYFVGLSISAGIIAWLYFTIEWAAVFDILKGINYWLLLPIYLVFIFHYLARAYRWYFLLPGSRELPFSLMFNGLMMGNFANFVLPLRAGEFIRPLVVSKASDIPYITVFLSVVLERFFDLATVLLCFGLILLTLPGVPTWVYSCALSLGVLAVGILAVLLLAATFPEQLRRLTNFFSKFLPESLQTVVSKLLDDVLRAATVLHDVKNVLMCMIFSALVWASIFVYFQCMLILFGLGDNLWLGISVGTMVALAVAAPSAPGFIGVFQTGCIAAFVMFGLPEEKAVAYSIVSHVHQALLIIVYGAIQSARLKMNLKESIGADTANC